MKMNLFVLLIFVTTCIGSEQTNTKNYSDSYPRSILSKKECANYNGYYSYDGKYDRDICQIGSRFFYFQEGSINNIDNETLQINEILNEYNVNNFNLAYKKFYLLSQKNNAEAQYYLALMYANAQYVEKDMISAYAWSKLSAKNGFEKAKEFNAVVKKLLTKDDAEKGDKKYIDIQKNIEISPI